MAIKKEKQVKLESLVLWHAPYHDSLVNKFDASEEQVRDQEAMQVLLAGVEIQDENFAKAKKLISKNEPLIFKLGESLAELGFEEHYQIRDLIFNGRNKEQANELVNKTYNYLYRNYLSFKEFYSPRYERNQALAKKRERTKTKLVAIAGLNTVSEVESLIKGGRW